MAPGLRGVGGAAASSVLSLAGAIRGLLGTTNPEAGDLGDRGAERTPSPRVRRGLAERRPPTRGPEGAPWHPEPCARR